MSSDPNQVNRPGQAGAESRDAKRGGDSLLSTIQDLQSRFDSLKQVHEESERREQELARREAAAIALEHQARQRDEESARVRAELEAARAQSRDLVEQAAREREEIKRLREEAETGARAVSELEEQLGAREREIAARAEHGAAQAREIEAAREAVGRLEEQVAEREHVVGEQDKRIAERELRAAEVEKRTAAAEFRLGEQRQAAAREQAALAERDKQIAEREGRITSSERELETLKKRFAEQAVRVAEREGEFEETQQSLKAREGELARRAEEIERARKELSERANELAARARSAEEIEQRAAAGSRELEASAAAFAERELAIVEHETRAAEAMTKAEVRSRQLESAASEAEERQRVLEELEGDLSRREQAAAEALAHAAERESEAARRAEALATEARESREALLAAGQDIERRDAALRESETAMRKQQAELRRQADELERSRVAVAEQAKTLASASADAHHGSAIHSGRLEQIQIQLGEANAKKAATETELAQSRREIARLVEELRTLTSAAAKAKEAARNEVERRGSALAELEAELEAARREAREHAERAGKAERAAASTISPERLAEQEQLVERLRGELKEAGDVNESLRRRVEDAEARGGGADAEAPARVAARDREIEELTRRLEEAEFKAMQVAEELEAARNGCGEAETAGVEGGAPPRALSSSRRERLRRYKSLLQAQARKIVTAQTALQKRHTDCEQVLAQRARLAAVAADVARREKKLASTGARSGAAAAVLYAVATLAILAVISWQVAAGVWPGTFIASATLEADTHGRTPTENELATWQNYHAELLDNPALIEMAADRMARRGLVAYGSPAELRSKLQKDLYHQTPQPGVLTIELKHEGADKAKLVLDTLVTSIKSVSDAQRDQRPDDLGVIIAQAAATGSSPLSDSRLENAGMILGGGALAAGLFGMVIWSRLARAKHKFEHAQAVEAALNEVDWSAMEQSMKRSAPGASSDRGEESAAAKKRRR